MPASDLRLPVDFLWGAATASYQVEGAVGEDGRGESIWDRFCATPGKVRGGDTGAVACDFFHRYPQDIELMADLGLDAFRFSIAWPRVVPKGRGAVNQAGLDFYDRLVDALLAQGIQPFPTLYHWDLPQALEDEGGWTVRSTAEAFLDYAEAVAGRLGDRVIYWTTHNEPSVAAWLGYQLGIHAPGRTSQADSVAAAHHLLLSHGWVTDLLRGRLPDARVGIALAILPAYPAGEGDGDLEAARRFDGTANRWFLDPLLRGEYPADALEQLAPIAPPVRPGDLETIARPLDFLGINYYFRQLVRERPDGGEPAFAGDPDAARTAMGWPIYPQGLFELLLRLRDDYDLPPIYITENGAAFGDVRVHDGSVRDPERVAYVHDHLAAVARAVDAGAPVRGYFVWSLLDNFEWAEGYSKRFGIVYVDYPTLERVPKSSFGWYRDLIASTRSAAVVPVAGG
jgi:beta-glucosidase